MLHFRIEGDGPVIVFLHGFMESSSMWNFLPLENLPFRKIFIDLPGHGKSFLNPTFDKPSLDYFLSEVIAVMTALDIKQFHAVGHSMGGYVALLLKEELNACEKVLLLNSNFWADNEQKKKDRIRMADIAFKSKRVLINEAIPNLFGEPNKFPLEIEQLKTEALQMSSESIAYASLAMRERKDFSKPIQNNPTDFFIIHGKQDRLVQTQEIKDKTPNSTNLMIIENAGHMAHIESPEMVMSHLGEIFC